MQKKIWINMVLCLIIPGLLLTVSCAKRPVKSQPAVTAPVQIPQMEEEDVITSEEAERLRKPEDQRIEEQRLAEEQQRLAEEEQRLAEQRRQAALAERQKFMNQDIYFDFDKSYIRLDAQNILKQKAEYMNQHPEISVIIEGHCDERGTNEYNIALGERRAVATKQFMIRLGISADSMVTVSYGEERPADPGHSESAWAKNRRVHFDILQ